MVTLVGILLLLLGVMTVAVVLADPTVDGDIGGDSAWQSSDVVVTDSEDGLIADEYDIADVYMRSSDDNVTFFGGFEVYSDSMIFAENASISFAFDTDADSGTGGSVDSGACPNIGAEYRHDYLYVGSGDYINRLKRWTGTAWEYHADALAAESPDYEMAVAYYAIGLTETKCISVAVYFENRADDPDDSLCDVTWCYTDGVTVVDLSSFDASSERSDSPVVEPGMLALLGLALALFGAGGLVLWRGTGLAH